MVRYSRTFLFFIPLFSVVFVQPSNAGIFDNLFGYTTYDECILDKMPEVKVSNIHPVVAEACRSLMLKKCKIVDARDFVEFADKKTMGISGPNSSIGIFDFFNTSPDLQIISIDLRFFNKTDRGSFDRVVRSSLHNPIAPQTKGTVKIEIG